LHHKRKFGVFFTGKFNNNFQYGFQANYVKLLCVFSGEFGQKFKSLTTRLLQWLDYFSSL